MVKGRMGVHFNVRLYDWNEANGYGYVLSFMSRYPGIFIVKICRFLK